MALVEQGRTIYQRILTWIINKISRTILKAAFVAIAFVVTGKFVVSAFAMLLLVFMTDFAKISLATDNVRPSKKPETWNIGGFITVSVVLGVAMVAETLFLLWIGWSHFGLATDNNALYTFSFLMLLYFAVFSVVSARERRWFWATLPSKTFMTALAADALTGTVLTFVGLPGLRPYLGGRRLRYLFMPWSRASSERRREGRDDQLARSSQLRQIGCRIAVAGKSACAEGDVIRGQTSHSSNLESTVLFQALSNQAVLAAFNPSRASTASRITNFWILPVTVIGNSSTNSI